MSENVDTAMSFRFSVTVFLGNILIMFYCFENGVKFCVDTLTEALNNLILTFKSNFWNFECKRRQNSSIYKKNCICINVS
jgi:hypothetical protein